MTELIEKMIRMKESGEADICHGYHVSADIYLPPMTLNVDADTVESELRNFLGAYAKVASIKVDETGREKAKALEKAEEPLELSKKLERKRPCFPDREEAGGKPKTLKKLRKKAGMFIADMIAPCGLDCSICKRALSETGPCFRLRP